MKHIIYITNTRLPTEKAHGLATMRIAEAFASLGARVEIFAPRRRHPLKDNSFTYYKSRENFKIKKIPCLDFLWLKRGKNFFFWLQYLTFSLATLVYFIFSRSQDFKKAIFFSHDHLPLYFLSWFSPNIFYDIHDFPTDNFIYRRLLKKAKGFSVQTCWKIQELNKRFGVMPGKIVYWPNGTDIDRFTKEISPESARTYLNLPSDKKIVVYTGHLFDWKGVDTLVKAVPLLDKEILVYLVGGTPEDVNEYKEKIKDKENIILPGFRPHEEILYWLKAADILILPNTGRQDVSRFYTSPMKLFEYMAAGRPIVASRIHSIMEVVDDNSAKLVEPDNPEALARGIKDVLNDEHQGNKLAQTAQNISRQYTWEKRAQLISNLMDKVF